MTPLKGAAKFARGGAWLVLLLAAMGISLTLKYTVATRPPWVLIVAVPAWHDLATGAAICTVAVVAVNALASFELHRWFSEYGAAYGVSGSGWR